MSESQHNPLPWLVVNDRICGAGGHPVFFTPDELQRIVTAVNAHDGLLAAAKQAVREFAAIMEIGTEDDDCLRVRNALQAAIANAEEPAP